MQEPNTAAIVEEARQLVADNYVFPEIGERLAQLLKQRHTEGRYDGAGEPAALAALVTEDLQSINGDLHLRLMHHHDEIPDLPSEAMMIEMFTQQAAAAMGGVSRVERLDGNIGLLAFSPLLFPPSMAGEAIVAALQLVARSDALILDLRQCKGGDPDAEALVCSYLFDERVQLNDIYVRNGDQTTQYWTLPYVPGDRFGGAKPIYVLTSTATFSGGEALSYDLQQRGRATIIGERTGGGAHPRTGYRVHPHLELTVPTGRAINPVSGTNWEGCGVQPDVEVSADEALDTAHRIALKQP